MDKLEYLEHRRAIRRAYKEGGMANKEEMDQAAQQAKGELLDRLSDMDPQEAQGAYAVMAWFDRNYRTAGWRRLGRFIVNEVLPKIDSGEF